MAKSNAAIAAAKAMAAKLTKGKPDQRIAEKGGGFDPPAAGKAKLRFIGYVEQGRQVELFQGRPRERNKVQLVFELVNRKKHPPLTLEDGTEVPRRIKIELTESLSERATLFQLRRQMDPEDTKSHIAQMIGDAFIGKVYHHTFEAQGREITVARLKPKGGNYTIEPPFEEDEDGELTEIAVADPLSEVLLFFWDSPTLEMWDSLYIEGEYEKGRSKNVIQETLRRAVNWEGSPMYELLVADDRDESEYEPLEPTVQMPDADDDAPAKKPAKKTAKKVVDEEDDEDEPPKKAVKKAVKKAPVEEDEDEDEDEAPPPKAKKVVKKAAPVEEDEEDEEETPPPKKAKAKAKPPVDEDEDEDEEEAPPPKKAKAKRPADDEDDAPPSRAKRLAGLLNDI